MVVCDECGCEWQCVRVAGWWVKLGGWKEAMDGLIYCANELERLCYCGGGGASN
jgi:hypothetical protein